jgi:hypothetical protein
VYSAPPADALGQALARWVEARTQNVGRIIENADKKLGARRELPGSVPMRVAGRILEEGSYCDDDLVVEYLGGVLASSRSGISRDDRGARWVSLVTSMSAYEIRLHYLLYRVTHDLFRGMDHVVDWANDTSAAYRVIVYWRDLRDAMDFVDSEVASAADIVNEAMFALVRLGLVLRWRLADARIFDTRYDTRVHPDGALMFVPSAIGVQLFMWAHGLPDDWRHWIDSRIELADFDAPAPPATLFKSGGAILSGREFGDSPG